MGWLRSLSERIGTFFRLTPTERALFIRSWISLIGVDLTLRVVPVKRLLERSAGRPDRSERVAKDEVDVFIDRAAWLVMKAARFAPIRTTCLKESLVLHRILDRHRIRTELRIGVIRTGKAVQAHAWLERNGVPVFGYDPDDGYQPLAPA